MATAELDPDTDTVRGQHDALVLDGDDGADDTTLGLTEGASAQGPNTADLREELAGAGAFGELVETDDRVAADVVDDVDADQAVTDPARADEVTVEVVDVRRSDQSADELAAGGHGVTPPGGAGGEKRYGGGGEDDDPGDDVHGPKGKENLSAERPETARQLGATALEVADPRTEAARRVPEQVDQVEAIKVVAARYKAVEERPDPFAAKPAAPSAKKEADFSDMGDKGAEMTALVRNIKDQSWQEPWRLWPTERLIGAAHKATITQFNGVKDELKAVNSGIAKDAGEFAAAEGTEHVHLADANALDNMQADLATAAGHVPSPERVKAVVDAYNWLVAEKGIRVYERPEPGILANMIPVKARYSAHVGPVETSLERAEEMVGARERILELGSEMHRDVVGIARRDEAMLTGTLLSVLQTAKNEISGDEAQAAVRERRPEAGQLVAAESYVVRELDAAVAAMRRLDPGYFEEDGVARTIEDLQRPVLRGIADKAQADHETAITEDLNREVTRARDIMTGPQRVLRSIGNGHRKALASAAENLEPLTGTPEDPSTFTRAEAGLLLATTADPSRLTGFAETINRVRVGATDDEALRLVGQARNRAVADLSQVDPDALIQGLRGKLSQERVQSLLSRALTEEQQRQARIALGRYFDPEYDEPLPADDEAEAEAEPSTALDLTDPALTEGVAEVTADSDLVEKIVSDQDPDDELLEIMDALGLDISGDEIEVVLDWAKREIEHSDEPVNVQDLLLGMLGELEAARADASALTIEEPPDGVPEPEGLEPPEPPHTIEDVVTEYESLGFTIFPVGEQAYREAERIVDEAGEGAVIDLERVQAMVEFAQEWDARLTEEGVPEELRHMFIGRGPLGNRGMVTTADGEQVKNEYLVLVMLQADDAGHIRQQCWADSPVAERNAAYAWDSDACGIVFPNWERIFASTKQIARDEGGARRLKHTAPAGASVYATMKQRVKSLFTGPPSEFYRDTRLL